MEPPQLITEELLNRIREYLKKPENIGFVAGFSLTIVVAFILLSKLYQRRNNPKKAAHDYVYEGKGKKKGIMSHLVDYGIEYGLIFLISIIKENIQKHLEKLNEDLEEHKEELSGE